jgi:cephalosporin-C deacetylase-like acetyl esterase
MYNRRIYDVNQVTWDVVDRILRKLAKRVDKKYYYIYYKLMWYADTMNIINMCTRLQTLLEVRIHNYANSAGAPILVLSEAQKQKL